MLIAHVYPSSKVMNSEKWLDDLTILAAVAPSVSLYEAVKHFGDSIPVE